MKWSQISVDPIVCFGSTLHIFTLLDFQYAHIVLAALYIGCLISKTNLFMLSLLWWLAQSQDCFHIEVCSLRLLERNWRTPASEAVNTQQLASVRSVSLWTDFNLLIPLNESQPVSLLLKIETLAVRWVTWKKIGWKPQFLLLLQRKLGDTFWKVRSRCI